MGNREESYTISELAREFDITTRSIRFYEDQGLLQPTRRGQSRIYSRQDRVRLKLTLRGKRLGFSLAEIRALLDLYETDKSSRTQLTTMLTMIESHRAGLRQQMEDIRQVLQDLEAAESRCQSALTALGDEQTPT
ncbi:MerR family DNA-binding transcriptional regulator [Aeromonas schubertii]|uniref:MerR family DNA-binding transcriptional regulator n=1 Tax=Aeromonas schubertii TaxID=652 RepID=A0A0S2SGB7_9GAMM|nr:MerR family DNA-binding transcriptional regulator [Aeromonas schubertii]ALP40734.1 putative transcriptional regulator [Aeromonas schubertii]KUE78970.1 MerR family transcriptional regulator [Aeromonas schubertii]MBZ6065724.1 MerR family DNA-binding transcriptional regulator [Aeromonas schubertii]MBZ6072111.1 MerR family DNA-binding transcriptional regulator [Aeromonas schubertii]QCG48278.1 MerR family DNA-binding transcriptional regulator [Aeromonas schubertii]